ncbi:MAG: 30S ribosomal protein S18 [Spirochaetaceae bacterium]|nr:30S ribosomal protein S18 [Spirochaetaceae bacterium]
MTDERVEHDDKFADDKDRRGKPKYFKRKVCRFCANRNEVNYLDTDTLKRYITERGKILPGRITGACAKHQRAVTTAIKRARALALLPFVSES